MARQTRQIRVGSVPVGGGAPVSIQTMAKARPDDVDAIVAQLEEARAAGCAIARIAIPDEKAVETIPEIRNRSCLPIVADVHFDHRLAIGALRAGARLHPQDPDFRKAALYLLGLARKNPEEIDSQGVSR